MARMSDAEKLKQLEQQQRRIKAQFQQVAARMRASDRKKDTHRKIVAGAVVLKACETDRELKAKVWGLLDTNVVLNKDRVVFDLPPRPELKEKID